MIIISILTFNKLSYTQKCLESVMKTIDVPFKIVVSDNGSTDETIEYLSKIKGIQVILNNENLGFSKAHNRVIRMFPADDIVLMNNDIEVQIDWLKKLSSNIKEYGAVSPAIQTRNGLDVGAILDQNARGKSLINDFSREPDWITGSCLYITRDTINKIGLLSEDFNFYYEDVDYCFRMKQAGIKFKCIQDIIIVHHDSTSSTLERKKIMIEESRQCFAKKWGFKI